jgi:hypothetical protein
MDVHSHQVFGSRVRIVAALVVGVFFCSGCETIGQDLKEIGAGFTPTTPSEAARDMVDPHDADKRRTGTTLISNSPFGGVDVYVRAYRDMVDNERDPVVKAMAIRALARHGDPADAMRITPHLHHESVQVRWEAAKGLQRLHNNAAVPELLKVLRDESEQSDIRIAAATALGQYPQDRVAQGLIDALDARELGVNMAAETALGTLTGQELGLDRTVWYGWYTQAAAANQAFLGQREYLYPTYYRDDLWWERMMFWTTRNFENPGLPAGLRPQNERNTYQDDAPASAPAAQTQSS